ncbi:RNA-guided endonuclease TnpB family protein [Clostridium perfringens]
MNLVRKLKIVIDEENPQKKQDGYSFIRNEQYEQYRALNLGMSLLYASLNLTNINSGAENRCKHQIETLQKKLAKSKKNLLSAKKDSKINSLKNIILAYEKDIERLTKDYESLKNYRSDIDLKFKDLYIKDLYNSLQRQVNLKHKDNMSLITQTIKKDFSSAIQNGLAAGNRSLTTYKRTYPLLVRGRDLKFEEVDGVFYIKWIEGIKFKIILGRNDKDKKELQHTLSLILFNQNIFKHLANKDYTNRALDCDYKICDSSISFVDKNNLILNLNINIKDKNNHKHDFIEGRVLGVDLGVKVPAYLALNDIYYIRKSLGDFDSFMRVNMQFKARKRLLSSQLKKSRGGKGRKVKLRALESFQKKQSNYTLSYNHYLSKEIIKFAIKNKAGQINMEFLVSDEFKKNKLLSEWSYYQLQTLICYKAAREGIVVKFVDPYHTSQICSKCGHYEEGQRLSQDTFKCKNKMCNLEINADYNASRNIAKSKDYVNKLEDTQFYKIHRLDD